MLPATSALCRPVRTLVGCALVAVCAGTATAQGSVVAKKPFAELSASATSMRDSLVSLVRAQVGTPYVSGGQSPDRGFDCSGLVRYVMAALEVKVPRTARQQATVGVAVNRDATRLRPGDLLTFGRGKQGSVNHVGIYIGNGRYVHASSVAGRVIESDVPRPGSVIRAWRGVRRLVVGAASDSTNGGG